MAAVAALFVMLLLVGIGGSLLLYLFVREERTWNAMDRETAETRARRDDGEQNR